MNIMYMLFNFCSLRPQMLQLFKTMEIDLFYSGYLAVSSSELGCVILEVANVALRWGAGCRICSLTSIYFRTPKIICSIFRLVVFKPDSHYLKLNYLRLLIGHLFSHMLLDSPQLGLDGVKSVYFPFFIRKMQNIDQDFSCFLFNLDHCP